MKDVPSPPQLQPVGTIGRVLERARSLARRFLLLTIVVIGALCGVLAVLFHRFVEAARGVLIGRALSLHEPWRSLFVVLTPAIVFPLLAWCIRRFAPRAVGANLARELSVRAASSRPSWRRRYHSAPVLRSDRKDRSSSSPAAPLPRRRACFTSPAASSEA